MPKKTDLGNKFDFRMYVQRTMYNVQFTMYIVHMYVWSDKWRTEATAKSGVDKGGDEKKEDEEEKEEVEKEKSEEKDEEKE